MPMIPWSKAALMSVVIEKPTGCWEWQRRRAVTGHGQVRHNGTTMGAHRLAFELFKGPIPDGLCVLHHCDNPPCVNPAHLYAGTKLDNARDRELRGRGGDRAGTKNAAAVLAESDIPVIRRRLAEGKRGTPAALAAEYGVSVSAINAIRYGTSWTHV